MDLVSKYSLTTEATSEELELVRATNIEAEIKHRVKFDPRFEDYMEENYNVQNIANIASQKVEKATIAVSEQMEQLANKISLTLIFVITKLLANISDPLVLRNISNTLTAVENASSIEIAMQAINELRENAEGNADILSLVDKLEAVVNIKFKTTEKLPQAA